MDATTLGVLGFACLAVVLLALLVLVARLDPVPGRGQTWLPVAVLAIGAACWLALTPLALTVWRLPAAFYLPGALLGAIAATLVSIAPRSLGAPAARVLVFTAIWSVVVLPPAIAAFALVTVDHGATLPVSIAPGAGALGALLIAGARRDAPAGSAGATNPPRAPLVSATGGSAPRTGPADRLRLPIAVAVVVAGWIGWLVFAEIAIDDSTTGILLAGVLGAAGGIAGWVVVQLLTRRSTLGRAVGAGAAGGVLAVTAGAAVFDPVAAVVTGLLSGVVAGLVTSRIAARTERPQWVVVGVHLLAAGVGFTLVGIAGRGVGYIFTGQPDLVAGQLLALAVVAGWSLAVSAVAWLLLRPQTAPRDVVV